MGIDLPASAKHIRLTSHHPIDGAACLYPWPNDFFTKADPSTAAT